ncbi:MAG: ATPase [Rhodospirillaceae bacterium]|nr:ATPase [Rhodospirillaceae bacterium]
MRRTYKNVSHRPAGPGFALLLDGVPARTPARAELVVPTAALADAIAGEWAAQSEQIRPAEMPLTQLAFTALDRVALLREETERTLLAYGDTDLVCHRATSPAALVARQRTQWDPLLDWLAERHGARLTVTAGILPAAQPPEAIAALARTLAECDLHGLTALSGAAGVLGSLVIALALLEDRIDPDLAFEASQLDETFQMEQWGEDAEAAARRAGLHRDIAAIARYAQLSRQAD